MGEPVMKYGALFHPRPKPRGGHSVLEGQVKRLEKLKRVEKAAWAAIRAFDCEDAMAIFPAMVDLRASLEGD